MLSGRGCFAAGLSRGRMADLQMLNQRRASRPQAKNPLISGMRFIDVAYHYNLTDDPEHLLEAHRPNLGYFDHLPSDWECSLIKFANGRGHVQKGRYDYYYFQGRASKLWVPLEANRFIARLKPQAVLLHGLIFPHHLMMLQPHLERGTKIIVQHHGELPRRGVMQRMQRVASKYVDAYLFTTEQLGDPWVQQGTIQKEKIFPVVEGSSDFPAIDKHVARHHLQLPGGRMFLWVGRLNADKDPVTVLHGFARYLHQQPLAKLYMIFQEDDLLQPVQAMIASDERLRASVVLKGKMEKRDLVYWYNAADFFIAGSHREGSGYALIEAMSCGCIPVVTDIPSFRKITADGTAGVLFNCGNVDSLLQALHSLEDISTRQLSVHVKQQFEKELSFKAIANQITNVCEQLGCVV